MERMDRRALSVSRDRSRERGADAVWRKYLSHDELLLLDRSGYGKVRGLGKRPAVLVIDCQYNHIGADLPIMEQLELYPTGGGARAWAAVREIARVLAVARVREVPVMYTRYCYEKQDIPFDSFVSKRGNPGAYLSDAPGTEIVVELLPHDGALVVRKLHASAFFGTGLIRYLVDLRVDTLLLTGVSTSGCVRATAIDAVTRGYRVGIATSCVADRIEVSHCATLLDLWMKYADLLDMDDLLAYLEGPLEK